MKSVSPGSTILLALLALLASATFSAHAAGQAMLTKSNGVLVDGRGMTVYTFDKDSAETSACTGKCAENWPPVMAGKASVAAPYSVITREDGSKQLAYKGKPLYTFTKDKKAGDKTGDKAMNAWHAVTD